MFGRMFGLLALLVPVTANAARLDVIDLADYPMEKVWRCANSRVAPATDANGERVWRWEIGSGGKYVTVYFDDLTYTARRYRDYKAVRHERKITVVPYPAGGQQY